MHYCSACLSLFIEAFIFGFLVLLRRFFIFFQWFPRYKAIAFDFVTGRNQDEKDATAAVCDDGRHGMERCRYWLKGAPNRSEPYPDPKGCEDLKGYMIYCIIYHDVLFPSNLDHGSSVLDVCYCHFRTLPRFQNHQHWWIHCLGPPNETQHRRGSILHRSVFLFRKIAWNMCPFIRNTMMVASQIGSSNYWDTAT